MTTLGQAVDLLRPYAGLLWLAIAGYVILSLTNAMRELLQRYHAARERGVLGPDGCRTTVFALLGRPHPVPEIEAARQRASRLLVLQVGLLLAMLLVASLFSLAWP